MASDTSAREDAARAALEHDDTGWYGTGRLTQVHIDPAEDGDADFRHIALNDPATILADIEEMQRLRAVVEEVGAYIAATNPTARLQAEIAMAVAYSATLKEVSE